MKISLLTMPPESEDVYFVKPFRGCEHSGVQVLASFVTQAGHEAQVLDTATLPLPFSDILTQIKDFSPDVIGISPTLSSMKNCLSLAMELKQWASSPMVVMGGHHATLCAEEILQHESDVDVIFLGEAENSLVSFLDCRQNKTCFEDIHGIGFRKEGCVKITGPSAISYDLEQISTSHHCILSDLKEKHSFVGTTIQSSRGCPYQCSFCTSPIFFENGPRYRKKSVKHVADQMEKVCREFDIHLFNFTDDLFLPASNLYKKWGMAFAHELIQRNLPVAFSVMLRSDIFQPEFTGVIQNLQRAGMHQVLIGMESISRSSLEKYNKGTSVQHYHSAIRYLEELGIHLVPAFINFNPYLTRADFIGNITFLNEIVHAPVLFPFTSHLTVFPQTPMVELLQNDNLLIEYDRPYLNGFSYKFADPVIQSLSDGIKSVIEKPFPSDSLVEEVQHLLANNFAVGNLNRLEYKDLFKYCRSIHTEMAKKHYSAMALCLRFADRFDSTGVKNSLSDYYFNNPSLWFDRLRSLRDDLSILNNSSNRHLMNLPDYPYYSSNNLNYKTIIRQRKNCGQTADFCVREDNGSAKQFSR
jgi:radical SAM superfamily enzyme YgiQ (UPF0313 family)